MIPSSVLLLWCKITELLQCRWWYWSSKLWPHFTALCFRLWIHCILTLLFTFSFKEIAIQLETFWWWRRFTWVLLLAYLFSWIIGLIHFLSWISWWSMTGRFLTCRSITLSLSSTTLRHALSTVEVLIIWYYFSDCT
jgi:hypothetical protein